MGLDISRNEINQERDLLDSSTLFPARQGLKDTTPAQLAHGYGNRQSRVDCTRAIVPGAVRNIDADYKLTGNWLLHRSVFHNR